MDDDICGFDCFYLRDDEAKVDIEFGSYAFDDHSIVVGMQDHEVIFWVNLGTQELRKLATWANSFADMIENTPSELEMMQHDTKRRSQRNLG